MPQIGPLEILVVMVVALLVFGPEKLPELARNVGRTANQLRRMAAEVKEELSAGLDFDDDDGPSPPPRSASRSAGTTSAAPTEAELVDDEDWDRGEVAEVDGGAERWPAASEDSEADGEVARDTP